MVAYSDSDHFPTLGSWIGWLMRDGAKKFRPAERSMSGISRERRERMWHDHSRIKVRTHTFW